MELKRDIYEKLIKWKKESNGQSALLIEGARRIGKSTIAEKFAKENYRSYVLIDFSIASKAVKDDFLANLNHLDDFYQILSIEYNKPLYKRDTLFIFDEIQLFPIARQAIKHLVKDGRYDFIETGSLISIRENVENILIPSEEEKIKMYPLTFEEFLYAANEEALLNYIRECYEKKVPLIDEFHKRATRLFNEYILVGGMPRSVTAYFDSGKDFASSDKEKRRILSLYEDDIKKASKKYSSKVSALFENIPANLSTHEKKVVLSKLPSGNPLKFNQYDEPLFWLEDSMICSLCYKCSDPNIGLSLNKDESSVKCYMGDTGLLVSLTFSDDELAKSDFYKNVLQGKLSINKGMFFENAIAQSLVSKGKQLYFYTHYSNEKKRNDIEIDFLVSNGSKTNGLLNPIEVKSSKNYTTTSYLKFKKKFQSRIGESYIVHPKGFSKDENGYRIPGYMFFCI